MSKAPARTTGAEQQVPPHNTPQGIENHGHDGFIPLMWDGTPEQVPREHWLRVAALRYACHGLKVGALNGKAPLTPHGFKDFTTNLDTINQWWDKWPQANIGANPPKGFVVIDIDPRNDGHITWEALTRYRDVPETLLVRTGSGGHHFWYRLPHEGALNKTMGMGIDLKTHTGYLVMPPSIHPITGERYLISWWRALYEIPVIPEWMEEYIYKPAPQPVQDFPARLDSSGTGKGLVEAVATAVEGQRNQVLYWAACRNVEERLGIEKELVEAAQVCGLSEREAMLTIASAQRGQVA